MPLTPEEVQKLDVAKSIVRMAAEPAWQKLVAAMTSEEAKAIQGIEDYLDDEPHPDREELMTLALKWYAIRKNRKLWIQQVEEATEFKTDLKRSLLTELTANPAPVDELTAELLMEGL